MFKHTRGVFPESLNFRFYPSDQLIKLSNIIKKTEIPFLATPWEKLQKISIIQLEAKTFLSTDF